jgi:hypothetical protein
MEPGVLAGHVSKPAFLCTNFRSYKCDVILDHGVQDGLVCNAHGEMRSTYRILVGKYEGKKAVERPRHRWEDHVKIVMKR